jgi:hypothetical protein
VAVSLISPSYGLVIPSKSYNGMLETPYDVANRFPYSTISPMLRSENSTVPIQPRRLTRLPKSIPKKQNYSVPSPSLRISRSKLPYPAESAKKRARLLLGSLNRQNCFAKVLCGLGARPPTTKTDLVNDYVYLMEELMV